MSWVLIQVQAVPSLASSTAYILFCYLPSESRVSTQHSTKPYGCWSYSRYLLVLPMLYFRFERFLKQLQVCVDSSTLVFQYVYLLSLPNTKQAWRVFVLVTLAMNAWAYFSLSTWLVTTILGEEITRGWRSHSSYQVLVELVARISSLFISKLCNKLKKYKNALLACQFSCFLSCPFFLTQPPDKPG